MNKSLLLLSFLILVTSVFGVFEVGDTVDNYSWTDNTGTDHDIYELTNQGIAVALFWGYYF